STRGQAAPSRRSAPAAVAGSARSRRAQALTRTPRRRPRATITSWRRIPGRQTEGGDELLVLRVLRVQRSPLGGLGGLVPLVGDLPARDDRAAEVGPVATSVDSGEIVIAHRTLRVCRLPRPACDGAAERSPARDTPHSVVSRAPAAGIAKCGRILRRGESRPRGTAQRGSSARKWVLMASFSIVSRRSAGVHFLTPVGRLDRTTGPMLQSEFAAVARGNAALIVVNLSRLSMLPPAGIDVLLQINDACADNAAR